MTFSSHVVFALPVFSKYRAKPSFNEMREEVADQRRHTDYREHESVNGSPEMGCVSYVILVALCHPPAIQEVERSEDKARNRYWNQVYVNAHHRVEKHGCEQYGRYSSGCSDGIVTWIVLVLYEVRHGACRNGRNIEHDKQYAARRVPPGRLEPLFRFSSEEIKREHIEEQMREAPVHQAVRKDPVILPVVVSPVSVEHQSRKHPLV